MDAGKDKHQFYDFGLSVPADAEIQGIVVRLDARAASAPGANNGGLTFWLDGNQQFSYANIDNDARRVDYALIEEVSGVDNGTRGTYHFDAFELRRESCIGPLASRRGVTVAKSGEVNRLGSLFLAIKNFVQAIWKPTQVHHLEPAVVDIVPLPEKAPTLPMQLELPAAEPSANPGLLSAEDAETTTISYSYNPLSRLTSAQYYDGRYFIYTYDLTGNRLTEETALATHSYNYDNANRLTSVDGEAYSWDDNGNLLSDGVYTYTYTSNKLSSITGNNLNITYQYNGLGERVSQTVNGVTTHFTVDLNAGLSQVLSDGTNTYLYGVERIAQESTNGVQYFLTDALGSVRQMVDLSGEVLLARSYEPYGEVLASAGEGESSYGFTGEMQDSTGLVYLRARYYDPVIGRFFQKDPSKAEKNLYLYAQGNPILNTDPSGLFSPEEIARSFGKNSFTEVLNYFDSRPYFDPWPQLPKWGLLAALLDASRGDRLKLYNVVLPVSNVPPHL